MTITTQLIQTLPDGTQVFQVFNNGTPIGFNTVTANPPQLGPLTANLQAHLAQIETWISNNPAGAVLTAGQTLWLAQSLAGLVRLVTGLTATVGQAN